MDRRFGRDRTEEPAEVGDKLSNRSANKGIVTAIFPDDEMPHDAEGNSIDIALNPLTVPSRITDGQFAELAAGKIAQHDGDVALVRNFDPHRKYVYMKKKQEVDVKAHKRTVRTEKGTKEIEVKAHKRTVLKTVKEMMDERGLSDAEELFITKKNPDGTEEEQSVGEIMVGPIHTMKLTHQVQKKMVARGIGPNYDAAGAPLGGGSTGAQSLGGLGMYALLAHGAETNLQEMASVRSDASQRDFWYALQRGEPLPRPEIPFAFQKFAAYLEALGLNLERKGSALTLVPVTDREVAEKSSGEIDPSRALAGHQYKPEKGGMFDEEITGGLSGKSWSHFPLVERMPNPVFEKAIQSLTGITSKQFYAIMGRATGPDSATHPSLAVDEEGALTEVGTGATGPEGIRRLLQRVNVDVDLSTAEGMIEGKSGSERDALNRKIHILRALKRYDLTPDVYLQGNVSVLPPVFRPVVKLPTGSLAIDDLNQLYRYVGEVNNALKTYPPEGSLEKKELLQAHLYDLMKALAGTGGTVYDYSKDKPQGILAKISGTSPKLGFFQSSVLKRKQDMTGASTIIPEPNMGIDEVGIPSDILFKTYEPLLIRQLALTNIHYADAKEHIEQRSETAKNALTKVLKEYPLLLKRDPALHMFNVMGMQPKPVEGRAIQIHPLVTSGFNADFDGDSGIGDVVYVDMRAKKRCGGVVSTTPLKETAMPHVGNIAQETVVDLADFPRVPGSERIKGGVVLYDVPDGILVPAYENGKFLLKQVSEFSIHPECEHWCVRTLCGRELNVSADHSLAVLHPDTLLVTRKKPAEAAKLCVPVLRSSEGGTVPSLPESFQAARRLDHSRNDVVPLTPQAADELTQHMKHAGATLGGDRRNKHAFSQYNILRRQKARGYLTRVTALTLNKLVSCENRSQYLQQWFSIALDESVGWDVITSAEDTGERVTMYDLTVPDAWTFTMANGAVVWDSMRIFVPNSRQSAEEVRKTFPSKILFNRGSDRPMYAPTMDSAIGLYMFSLMDKGRAKQFTSKDEIVNAYGEGLDPTQPVKVGSMTTTAGRVLLQRLFGEDIITDQAIGKKDFSLKSKTVEGYLGQLARTNPKGYPDVVNILKDVGWDSASKSGLSYSIAEFLAAAESRDKVLDKYEARVEKAKGLTGDAQQAALQQIAGAADKDLRKLASSLADKGNRAAIMVESGEKPSWTQFKQFMLAPVLAADGDNKLVPHLIRTGYGDGLSQGAHTLAAIPARGGMVDKTISVSGPGYLTKQIIAPVIDMKVLKSDCKVTHGIPMKGTDPELIGRYLAKETTVKGRKFKAGTALTPEVAGFLGEAMVEARSPLHCRVPKGLCQRCHGDWPDGPPKLGTNIGVISAQSIGERGTQLAMRSFHSGGVDKSGVTSSFDRVEQILRMPRNLPNKAVVSKAAGPVKSVLRDPETGAHKVLIGDEEYFIPPRKSLTISPGQVLKPGDALTDGPRDPRDILEVSGMPAVRNYLTDELHSIYRGEGVKRRAVETVVRGITDLGIVSSPGGRADLVPGDKVSLATIEDWNRGRPANDQVKIEPVLVGVNRLGLDNTTDWLARLSFERLKDTIVDAAQRGWTSDLEGQHPIPRLAYGGKLQKQQPDRV